METLKSRRKTHASILLNTSRKNLKQYYRNTFASIHRYWWKINNSPVFSIPTEIQGKKTHKYHIKTLFQPKCGLTPRLRHFLSDCNIDWLMYNTQFPKRYLLIICKGANTYILRCLSIDYPQTQYWQMYLHKKHFLMSHMHHNCSIHSPRTS